MDRREFVAGLSAAAVITRVNAASLSLSVLVGVAGADSQEAVGPFASWVNVKSAFGAKGDGVTDDTIAIQAGLNSLPITINTSSPVLYFPAGTYVISATVFLTGCLGASIVGQDPTTTMFKWVGPASGATNTLFRNNGSALCRFDRLTFDASASASKATTVLFDDSTDGSITTRATRFPTGNQFSDCIFQNAGVGIQGAVNVATGSSESSVLRCRFTNLVYGVLLMNPNSLDWWHWNCTFTNCSQAALSNNANYTPQFGGGGNGAGAFAAYGCGFVNNLADYLLLNTGIFAFRDNLSASTGNCSGIELYYYTNAANTRLERNTISSQWFQGNMGPYLATDNKYAGTGYVNLYTDTPPDYLSVGDAFTTSTPVTYNNGPGRVITTGDSTVNTPVPVVTPAPFLPNLGRTIFEIPAGSTTLAIQTAINNAAALNGQRPIVHLQYGSYGLNTPLLIPPCDLQLVGDGMGDPIGTTLGGAIILQGPGSHVTLREFWLQGPAGGAGILIQNADQVGARIFMQQPELTGASSACLFVNGLNNALVEVHDAGIAGGGNMGLQVVGGSTPARAQTFIASGDGNACPIAFGVSGPANVVVQDFWWEINPNSYVATWSQVSGAASFMADSCHIYLGQNGPTAPCFVYQGFTGLSTIMNCNIFEGSSTSSPANMTIDAASTGSVWQVGNGFASTTTAIANAGTAQTMFNLNRQNVNTVTNGSIPVPDIGTPTAAWITTMLATLRATKASFTLPALASGITDIRMYRVAVNGGAYGVEITP